MNIRQLRVSEKIRHALSSIFLQGKLYDPELQDTSITVSEVRMTPDLKSAQIFVSPLGKQEQASTIVAALNQSAPHIRTMLAKSTDLRYAPQLYFKLDNSFENASKIDALLKQQEQELVLED